MHSLTRPLCLSSILFVAACGGSGSGGTTTDDPTAPNMDNPVTVSPVNIDTGLPASNGAGTGTLTAADLDAISDGASPIFDDIEDGRILATTASGSAVLNGFIAFGEDDAETANVGNITMTVPFDGGAVTGSASDFALFVTDDEENELVTPLPGTLAIEGGFAGSSLTADMTGNLTNDFDENITVDVELAGTLYDANGTNIIAGDLNGIVTNDAFNDGAPVETVGEFIVQ